MSTNPFRQTRNHQGPLTDSTFASSDSRRAVSDGSGSRTTNLFVDTKVPGSLERHVSFASPPVDTTIPAASYPSSPESLRSPPPQWGQPATPPYRAAFMSDTSEDLGRDARQDSTIQEALSSSQSNASIGQAPTTRAKGNAVMDTLSRFAVAPRPAPQAAEPAAVQLPPNAHLSLDVDAFKKLLLTGDSGRSTPGIATPPLLKQTSRVVNDSSSGTNTTSLSHQPTYDAPASDNDNTPRLSHEQDRGADEKLKVPPPAPAPRRGKSVKTKAPQPVPGTEFALRESSLSMQITNQEKTSRKPPTPPLARRHSHRTPSIKSGEGAISPSETSSPAEPLRPNQKAPPPPPIRRQHSVSQRRPSNDLAVTIEEPETEPATPSSSRRSSNDRPPPQPSRNSSQSVKRQSQGFMSPPPLPPPRRGLGSSRSSMDSFRPSLSSIMGEESGQESAHATESPRRASVQDQRNLNASNAESILAELANLQKEVDAARREA